MVLDLGFSDALLHAINSMHEEILQLEALQMRNKFADTFYELAMRDKRIVLVCADISPAGSMQRFRKAFPQRFINVGVSEQAMIGMCAGLAARGMKPFAYTIATFALYRAFEFVRDDLCYQNLPVTIVGIGGGLTYSTLGATHHAQEDIAIARALPNMKVIAPCDPEETEAATRWCAMEHDAWGKRVGPMYLRLGKAGEPDLTQNAREPWKFGHIRMLRDRILADICILSYGPIMKRAIKLADRFDESGRPCKLYSCHTLKPLDIERIAGVLRFYKHVIVIEECVETLGKEVRALAQSNRSRARIDTFALKDDFIHCYGTHDEALDAHGLAVDDIWQRVTQ